MTVQTGERVKLKLYAYAISTMNAGTFNTYHDGPASGASGDSFLTINLDLYTDEIIEVGANEIIGSGIYG